MTDGRPDGRTEGWVGQDGGHRQEGQVGQVKRVGMGGQVGRTGRDGRTGTGCSSMNVARGRRLTNARSAKIRRSSFAYKEQTW